MKYTSFTIFPCEQANPAGYGIWMGDNGDDFAQNAA